MRVLLDTHLLIWAGQGRQRLPRKAIPVLEDAANLLLFSSISIVEVAIKYARGRTDFRLDPRALRDRLLDNGYEELPLSSLHACRVGALPPIHKDPFDRLLIAQAAAEGIELLTADTALAAYGVVVRVVA